MMPLNPFLSSLAAPLAAKTVQAVVHVAHETGQSFLMSFSQLVNAGDAAVDAASNDDGTQLEGAQSDTLPAQLQRFAGQFRDWLSQQGVAGPYELKFHLADNGDPIANVVGRDSAKITEMLYEDSSGAKWLEQLTSLAKQANEEGPVDSPYGASGLAWDHARLSISSQDAYVSHPMTAVY